MNKVKEVVEQPVCDFALSKGDVIIINGLRRYTVTDINRSGFVTTIDATQADIPENKNGHCWHRLPVGCSRDGHQAPKDNDWRCCHCGEWGQFEWTTPEGHGQYFVGRRDAYGGVKVFSGNLTPCSRPDDSPPRNAPDTPYYTGGKGGQTK